MIKGGFQLGSKVVPHDSKSDLPLDEMKIMTLFISKFYVINSEYNLDVIWIKPFT